jgi:hypothetical protein
MTRQRTVRCKHTTLRLSKLRQNTRNIIIFGQIISPVDSDNVEVEARLTPDMCCAAEHEQMAQP